MAKEFKVHLGGKDRRLRFTHDDAEELERDFREDVKAKGLAGLLIEDALGFVQGKDADGKTITIYSNRFSPRLRRELLFLTLRHDSPKLTPALLSDWIQAHLDQGGAFMDLVAGPVKCAFYSGAITGSRQDLDVEMEKAAEELGKAPTTETEEDLTPKPAAIPAAD